MKENSFFPQQHQILVVDDTSVNRRLYASILENEGYPTLTAESGVQALELIEEHNPSLILLDYMMPGMDGLKVLETLRNRAVTAEIPVVMLTASAEPDHIDAALEAGANDYITKPINGKILTTRVKAIIQADRLRDQIANRRTEALYEELEEAAHVQQAQLPPVPCRWHDWEMTGVVAPSGQVGGDIFDLVPTENGRFIALLLDVSGHGTASALVAAETRAELRVLLAERSLLESVQRLNVHLARRQTKKFSCLAAIEIEGDQLRILNAGLPPIALLRGPRAHSTIWGSGIPLGMFEDSTYELTELTAQAGDRLVLLSDGLTEPLGAIDGSLTAIERLSLWPSVRNPFPDVQTIKARISTVTRQSAPELRDDATVVLLERAGALHLSQKIPAHPRRLIDAIHWVLSHRPPWAEALPLDLGLTEALTNSIVHGALGLSSQSRTQGGTHGYQQYLSHVHELPSTPQFSDKQIQIELHKTPSTLGIRLSWEGTPCPPELRYPQKDASQPVASGMGMQIIHALFQKVVWDEDGLGVELWLYAPDP